MQECQVKLKCLPCGAEYYSLYHEQEEMGQIKKSR